MGDSGPMQTKRRRIELTFTDIRGRRWRVFDWRMIAGTRFECLPGDGAAEMRGFLSLETGERRTYRFTQDAQSRAYLAELLDRQLERATRVGEPPQPIHAERRANRNAGGR